MRNWRKRQQAHSGEGLAAAIYKKEVFGQKILDFEFSHGYHYSHTLVDTQEKTLGSFQPKLMTKIEVIDQKLPKWAKIAKKWQNEGKKFSNFEFSWGHGY